MLYFVCYRAFSRVPVGVSMLCFVCYRAFSRVPAGAPSSSLHHGPGVPVCAGPDPQDVLPSAHLSLAHSHHWNGQYYVCLSISVHLQSSQKWSILCPFYLFIHILHMFIRNVQLYINSLSILSNQCSIDFSVNRITTRINCKLHLYHIV